MKEEAWWWRVVKSPQERQAGWVGVVIAVMRTAGLGIGSSDKANFGYDAVSLVGVLRAFRTGWVMAGEWVGCRRYVISEGQLMGLVFAGCDIVD